MSSLTSEVIHREFFSLSFLFLSSFFLCAFVLFVLCVAFLSPFFFCLFWSVSEAFLRCWWSLTVPSCFRVRHSKVSLEHGQSFLAPLYIILLWTNVLVVRTWKSYFPGRRDNHAVSPEKAPLLSCLGNFTHGASVLCRGWGKETEGPRVEHRVFPLCSISAFRASHLSVWSFCGSVFPENKASFLPVG